MRRPGSTGIETLRDAGELVGSSRITSSARRDSFALKCRVNGISVRTLTRGRLGAVWSAAVELLAKIRRGDPDRTLSSVWQLDNDKGGAAPRTLR